MSIRVTTAAKHLLGRHRAVAAIIYAAATGNHYLAGVVAPTA